MFSISAKFLLPLAALFVFLYSCSRDKPEPLWGPESHLGSKDYNGGLFPVWITLKEPVKDVSIISWRTGNSRIAYRKQAMNYATKLITADTAFLYWDAPPPPSMEINDADTVYYYRDTVFAIVDGLESTPIVIEVKNILPRIANFSIDGLEQPIDSLLTIAAHLGDRVEISITLEKSFNRAFYPIVKMPKKMGNLTLKPPENDSLFVYEWIVPNEIIADSSIYLQIEDSGGYGERLYKLYLVVYTEFGSVWVASEKDIVKYSSTGVEVARISESFNSISDISVNSNNGKLFVTDQSRNSFSVYDTYGKLLYRSDSLFKTPTGVAVDVEGNYNYVWVTDAGRLRSFEFTGDSLRSAVASFDISGLVKGLSVDQFQSGLVWFAIPQSDSVGFVRRPVLETEPKFMPNAWNRPSMVSLDQTNGTAWVADSSRIVAIDTAGKVLASIKGFGFVSSVSASGGSVWASDILEGTVYRFKGPFRGREQDTILNIRDGMAVKGFLSPVSVSAFVADGGAWVVDKEAGKAVLLDSLGNTKAYGTGLKFPNLSKTLQKVE
jgi:DNA-binding beta-propeller fold protein YncE